MEQINLNDLLKFNENHLQKVREALGYEDVNKLKQDIDNLDDWIKKQDHFMVKDFDKEYLERWLIYNKGSVERTKNKFDKFCTCTNLMPDILQNFDIKNEFHHIFTVVNICVLPKPTHDNYRLLMVYFTGEDDSEFNILQYYRYFIVLGHYMMCHDYCQGYEIVADASKINMNTIIKLNPVVLHKLIKLFVEGMGQRVKKLHLLSGSKFFDILLMICKQGLTAKLKERLVIQPNVESLHKTIPREQLPKEFGGDERSMKELTELNFKEFSTESHIRHVKFMEKVSTDESLRLVSKFKEEYSGIPGSFKTLCVD